MGQKLTPKFHQERVLDLQAKLQQAQEELAEQRALVWRDPERLAAVFHKAYERLAHRFGYKTRAASNGRWEQVPDKNKRLMIATCRAVIDAPAEAQEGGRPARLTRPTRPNP